MTTNWRLNENSNTLIIRFDLDIVLLNRACYNPCHLFYKFLIASDCAGTKKGNDHRFGQADGFKIDDCNVKYYVLRLTFSSFAFRKQ